MTTVITKVSAKDIFDSLGREENNQINQRRAENLRSPCLERIMNVFMQTKPWARHALGTANRENIAQGGYHSLIEHDLLSMPYSARDIRLFSLALSEGMLDCSAKNFLAGVYITKLAEELEHRSFIENLPNEPVTIHTRHLTVPLDGIGYNMRGNSSIVVEGDLDNVGEHMFLGKIIVRGKADLVGDKMCGGIIKVEGNAHYVGMELKGGSIEIIGDVIRDSSGRRGSVGFESRGQIYVRGNVDGRIGKQMYGGEINVDGKVAPLVVGEYMSGGTIRMNGRTCNVSRKAQGGRIYHKNKLIYDGSQRK